MILKLVDLFAFFSVLLRAGTLVFQSVLIGGVMFLLAVARSSPEINTDSVARVRTATWRLLRISAIGLAIVQLTYLYVDSSVLMATAEIGFAGVVGANFFISGAIVLTASVIAAFAASERNRFAPWLLPLLAITIMGASVMTNHAASRMEGRPLLIALSSLHELVTGFWIGGLPFLILGLVRARDTATQWQLTKNFSRLALLSVALLLLSGGFMSIIYIGSWRAVVGAAYGVMVLAKATMLGVLLLLGGVNYLLLRDATPEQGLPRLRRLIEAEVGIGITVILTAASLTSQPPAVDQPNETVSFHQIYQRLKPTVPRFKYQYISGLPSVGINASAKGAVIENRPQIYNVDGVPRTVHAINDAIESESNHHWMGLVVLAMGLLALFARTGKAQWAEYWPLLLIGISIFIFVQADTECWPVGSKGVGACWVDPEVFQHRIAAIVCAAFAIFELRVRRQHRENSKLALVFPLMCALGGAVLLTHSHAITNVKENLLVELSHVPLGICAAFAGWARWLELRLPAEDRKIPSWIWPACFVLIGLGLLNYREM
ncbi:copper resistance D [Candidatus Koribacter versatilis Ellin345]|uniref:Copper resistance D n=1 Tax=Koribacter versatilis (strain Ellin345) TaxID=204669 RepID=Q1IJD0_KORVE|nr:CopD family protein [Candidatus Koribacter versatilis]ABF43020.1 copper resistance D [Candidatus Koribacter versatilis Ellin345]